MADRLKKIRIVPLASESFGVRSMCTYVETSDVKVLLDPGASLAPNRFGFSPHPKEHETMMKCRERISKSAEKAEVVTISHYHFNHHTPSFKDWCITGHPPRLQGKSMEGSWSSSKIIGLWLTSVRGVEVGCL